MSFQTEVDSGKRFKFDKNWGDFLMVLHNLAASHLSASVNSKVE